MKTLTLVIPVFNEASRLSTTFAGLKSFRAPRGLKLSSVIFVNDGSTDATGTILKKRQTSLKKLLKAKVVTLNHPTNQGKGQAVKTGMLFSESDYTLMLDADMSTDLNQLTKFVTRMQKNQPVLIGTRKNGEAHISQPQPLHRRAMGHVFTLLANVILNTWVSDFTCGFKLFNRQAKQDIFTAAAIQRWGYDAEIMFLARKFGYPITEITVEWHDEKGSRVRVLRAAVESFIELLRIRWYEIKGVYSKNQSTLHILLNQFSQ